MSWKYSSHTPRDFSSGHETSELKFGFSNAKFGCSTGDRWSPGIHSDGRLYRSSGEPVEHSPLWAKTRGGETSASVQRLKERYNCSEEPTREIRTYKKSDTKELGGNRTGKAYGRSLTSLILSELDSETGRPRRPLENSSEIEKERGGMNSFQARKLMYMPTATTKLLTRKYSNDLVPATVNAIMKDRFARSDTDDGENFITVVTRGTSPTPKTSTVYLRSKRTNFGLEKKVLKPHTKTEVAHKEVQTDRECLPKFGTLSESGSKPSRPSYSAQVGSSYVPKFLSRANFGSESRLSNGMRSTSREDSDGTTPPEIPHNSLSIKPPAPAKISPTSPVKDSEKKTLGGKSPPSGRLSFTSECAKSDLKPNSPTHPLSPLHCKVTITEVLVDRSVAPSPKVTVDRCADIPPTIDDVSSASESSEEETSSEDDHDEPLPAAMSVKKSVTNFLQNIPNHLPQNPSRSSLCPRVPSLSPQKVTFQKIDSGERAWWLDVAEKTEVLPRARSTRSVPSQEPQCSNLLSPPYMLNRQFSRDSDWLKGSHEDISKPNGNSSLKDEQSAKGGVSAGQGLMNGEPLAKTQRSGNCVSGADFDLNEQMKFNQQSDEYFANFQRECNQKLQNGLEGAFLEDKNLLEASDMSGMISRAKAGLAKSKAKLDVKKSSSREMSPKVSDTKSEIDLYWRELADSLTRPLTLCDLDFTDLNRDDDTDILGNNFVKDEVPPPPPMLFLPAPSLALAPSAPASSSPRIRTPAPPPLSQIIKSKKTVKLFWKEIKDEPHLSELKAADAAPLIWDEIAKVTVDTQKLEYLFESRAKDLLSKKQQEQNKNKEVIVLDPKRSNAINIGMTKLPPPRAIKTAILKMDATVVNKEGIDKLLTMLPTEEEQLRIQEAQAANPDVPLGSAEQFLITLASISEIEARLRLWAFKLNFDNNEKEMCEPLMDLKQGMEILRANRTFRAILATLLSIGNFLNGCEAKGFQIDYLSKVPEVKDTVYKHSLLHHLCLMVMEKFPESTDLYSEIGAVTRASKVDFDELAANIKRVEEECKLSWNYLKMIAKHEGHTAMKVKMSDFLADCAERIIVVEIVHKRIISRFQKFIFWLGVPTNRLSTTRPNEIFKTISEFALEYRTTRDRVLQQIKKINREKSRTRSHMVLDPYDMGVTKVNSKTIKDDAKLKQLLRDETTNSENTTNGPAWRRQRKDTKNLLDEDKNDEEILDVLLKTANQMSSPRLKERRRSRVYGKYCEYYNIQRSQSQKLTASRSLTIFANTAANFLQKTSTLKTAFGVTDEKYEIISWVLRTCFFVNKSLLFFFIQI